MNLGRDIRVEVLKRLTPRVLTIKKTRKLKFLLNSAVGKLPRFLKKKIILVAFRCSAKFWVIFEAVLMFNQCVIEVVVSSSPVFLPDDLPNMPSVR